MGKLLGLATGLILVSLFTFAMINFGAGLAQDHNINGTIKDDAIVKDIFGNTTQNLKDYESTAVAQRKAFEADEPITGFGSLLLVSIVGAGKAVTSDVVSTWNVLELGAVGILRIDPRIIGSLTAILLISLVFYVWSVVKSGN